MKIKPCGWKLSVLVDKVESVSKGGIILPDSAKTKEQNASVLGTVLAIGSECWDGKEPWCKVGDRVMIAKYGGFMVNAVLDKETDDIRVLNDEDIVAVVED